MDSRRHTLVLMRHAKSSWNSDAVSDFDRPLNRRGQTDAPRMGKWLAQQQSEPDSIMVSPALRTRQTIAAVIDAANWQGGDVQWQQDIYGAGARCLLSLIHDLPETTDTALIVGHNPAMDDLVDYLSMEPVRLSENGKLMATASIAVFSFSRAWGEIDVGSGQLQVICRPRELVET